MANQAFTVRMDEAELKAVDDLAKRQARSRNELIREAVAEKLAFDAAQTAKVLRGLADADAGRFANEERIAEVLNRHLPK